jgi:hypothetical protein
MKASSFIFRKNKLVRDNNNPIGLHNIKIKGILIMFIDNVIMHRINYGDTLYNIAKMYNTTVEDIISANIGINPYNLRVGEMIKIFPGHSCRQPAMPDTICESELELYKNMRLAWVNHAYWDRLVMISIVDNLQDTNNAVARALRTAEEISKPFQAYYGNNTANTLKQLLTEHISIAGDLIKATKNKDTANIDKLNADWYENADKTAYELSNINPYYDMENTRRMLYRHLDLLKEQLANRLAGNYNEDVNSSDKIVNQAMRMADDLVDGIIRQFPDRL